MNFFKKNKMFFYLTISAISSIISYALAKSFAMYSDVNLTQYSNVISPFAFFRDNRLPLSINQLFWYCSIQSLFFCLLVNSYLKKQHNIKILDISFYKKNKLMFFLLALPVFSSQYKAFLNGTIPMIQITIYSFLGYIFSIVIKPLFVKEKKITKIQILILIIAMIGFLITKIDSSFKITVSLICIGFSLVNGFSDTAKYYASKSREGVEGAVVDSLLYVLIGFLGFFFTQRFEFKYILSWQVFLVGLPCILQHVYTILGNKESKHFVYVVINNFMKLFWTMLIEYIFFVKTLNLKEIVGVSIIIIAILIDFLCNEKEK